MYLPNVGFEPCQANNFEGKPESEQGEITDVASEDTPSEEITISASSYRYEGSLETWQSLMQVSTNRSLI